MAFIFPLVLVLIIVAVIAGLHSEGCWSNIVTMFNTLVAALVASNYFEPLAGWIEEKAPAATYLWDFVCLWALFVVTMFVMRLLTDKVSRVKVRFIPPVEMAGTYVFALLVAWVLVCFTTFSLHTAPLARNFLWEGFRPEQHMLFGLAPDRKWLGFLYNSSQGALATSGDQPNVFDKDGSFMIRYAGRRASYEAVEGITSDAAAS
ncbi:MAG: CvpA family protein [Planctomycetales bacterium]|nr:CvpA family protein [Planctomycetales bacterium]